jgi:hypothetical protein
MGVGVFVYRNLLSAGGAYPCTMARTNSYFDVYMGDDASSNDCGFTFIVLLTSKFWSS